MSGGTPRGLAVVRGGGELGSAAARLLFLSGFHVVVLERAQPLAVRRLVCFAEAVRAGACAVEGVPARRVDPSGLALEAAREAVLVVVDPDGSTLSAIGASAVVDARMAKRNLGPARPAECVTVGLGPGFTAGEDVDAVVETNRGPGLGRVLWSGAAEPDTAVPAPVLGHREERVLRAPRGGTFVARRAIGDVVACGEVVGEVGGEPVSAGVAGLVRGLLAPGVAVDPGVKVGDVDPRGTVIDPGAVSDKARAVAAGVLEAVLVGLVRAGGRA